MDPGGSAENCTAVLDEPVTVALKAMISPGESVTDCGWIERVTWGAPSTVTTEVADLVGSAWALATSRELPAPPGGAQRPCASLEPASDAGRLTEESAEAAKVADKRAP